MKTHNHQKGLSPRVAEQLKMNVINKHAPDYTNAWFDTTAKNIWAQLLPSHKPLKVLEIGSFEGRSVSFLIEICNWSKSVEIHCVDTWEGGIEHKSAQVDMRTVEERFDHNTGLAVTRSDVDVHLVKHKGYSDAMMAALLAEGHASSFDFIYVDGSHQAPDVLCDSVLAFKLAKVGAIIGFDDYTWSERLPGGKDPIRCPKIAIDAFTNIYCRKLQYIHTFCNQVYVQKISE